MKLLVPPIYYLTADGVGEYMVRHEDGRLCLFLFTSEESVKDFVGRMEMPEHKDFTATPLVSTAEIIAFLKAIKDGIPMIALDPITDFEVAAVAIDDLAIFRRD